MFEKYHNKKTKKREEEEKEKLKAIADANKAKSEEKIIEQLPKGISIEDFWDCARKYETSIVQTNKEEKYKSKNAIKDLTSELYTDKVIKGTLENLPELLKEIKVEYKGGGI